MNFPHDIGASLAVGGELNYALVAGAATDNDEQETAVVDRLGFNSGSVFIPWAATCTDKKKLTVTVKRYQSADGTNFDAAETIQAATDVFTAADPALAATGIIRVDEDWSSLKRYVKYGVTADLSASQTDTASYAVVVVKGGATERPAND